jgi:hypothetical protein
MRGVVWQAARLSELEGALALATREREVAREALAGAACAQRSAQQEAAACAEVAAAVSHSCACIGSPCLRHCVHGDPIGGQAAGGGGGTGRGAGGDAAHSGGVSSSTTLRAPPLGRTPAPRPTDKAHAPPN